MGFPETFKALSDPVRREILIMLRKGKMSAGEIGQHFDMTGATISYHLSQLKKAGLISETKYKNYIYYEINVSVIEEIMLWFSQFNGGKEDGKKNKSVLILTTLLCLLPIILSVTLYDRLPDRLAIHWDAAGNPDNYASKAVAAFVLPLMLAVMNVIVNVALNHDPKRMNAAPALRMFGYWSIPVLSCILTPVTLFKAMGADIPIDTFVPALVGLLFVIIGNYLPKSKQNYTVGIKLPWTLNSQDNWNRTHRFAGYVWMVGGLLLMAVAFLDIQGIYVTLPIIVLIVFVPAIYSFSLYKRGV